jgi:hypothetical protein
MARFVKRPKSLDQANLGFTSGPKRMLSGRGTLVWKRPELCRV